MTSWHSCQHNHYWYACARATPHTTNGIRASTIIVGTHTHKPTPHTTNGIRPAQSLLVLKRIKSTLHTYNGIRASTIIVGTHTHKSSPHTKNGMVALGKLPEAIKYWRQARTPGTADGTGFFTAIVLSFTGRLSFFFLPVKPFASWAIYKIKIPV